MMHPCMVSLPTLTIKINHSCTGKYTIPMGGMRLDFEDLNVMAKSTHPPNVSPSEIRLLVAGLPRFPSRLHRQMVEAEQGMSIVSTRYRGYRITGIKTSQESRLEVFGMFFSGFFPEGFLI